MTLALSRRGLRLVAGATHFAGARVRNPVLLTLGLVGSFSAGVAGLCQLRAKPSGLGAANRPLDSGGDASDRRHRCHRRGDDRGFMCCRRRRCSIASSRRLDRALLLLVLLAAGHAAMLLTTGAPAAVRVSLGTAFWIVLFCTVLTIVDAFQRLRSGPLLRLAVATVIFAAIAAMAGAGQFDALSIVREYENRRDVFTGEIERHCALVLGALLAALATWRAARPGRGSPPETARPALRDS